MKQADTSEVKPPARNPRQFNELGLSRELLRSLDSLDFRTPTDVQIKTIPVALRGHDIMVQSRTGTGKTAAFGLPILQAISQGHGPGKGGIRALVLAPTRELCIQISREMQRYNHHTKAHIVPIYGGQKIETQFSLLRKGADIVVGTPGRLIDHLGRKTISLLHVRTVVLDEADRMLDMGFIEDIVRILRHTPEGRQTMLFTATLLYEVQMLARDFMKDPEKIMLGKDELVVPEIQEAFYRVGRRNKLWALMQIISLENPVQGIVFCETKRMVDIVADRLHKLRMKAAALHGDLRQHKRERIMDSFRKGEYRFLVATDVAARGLDIPAVSHVFNYDVPENKEQYVHRVGRTGRIGAKGRAITFVSRENLHALSDIERFLNRKIEFDSIPEEEPSSRKGKHPGAKPDSKPSQPTGPVRNPVRKILDFDDMSDQFGMLKMKVDAGEKHGLTKFDLLEYLSSGDPMRELDIGNMTIGEEETIIEVKTHAARDIMNLFQRRRFRGRRLHYEFEQIT